MSYGNYRKGIISEFVALLFLFLKGYSLLKHRYSNYCGEIDFILKKGKSIIFVEVKFRNKMECIAEAITDKQKNRIRRSASIFMKRFPDYNARFDAVLISYFRIEHLKNCF